MVSSLDGNYELAPWKIAQAALGIIGLKVTRVDKPRDWRGGLTEEEMGRPKGGER